MDTARFAKLQDVTNSDPEFCIAARFWHATLRLEMGEAALQIRVVDGRIAEVLQRRPAIALLTPANIIIAAPAAEWGKFLEPIPKPFYADLWSAAAHHGFTVGGDMETFYAYYPAIRRLMDILRTLQHGA
jgi:hypothetical protein